MIKIKDGKKIFEKRNILKLVLSYILFILGATLILKLPILLNEGQHVSLLDAFFMANSSIATTGLTIVDYTTTYNYLGWFVMIVLFNIGGIGIILFNTLLVILVGKRLNFSELSLLRLDYNQSNAINFKYIIQNIIKYFVLLELFGAFIFFIRMYDLFPNPLDRIMNALFLSSSAISGSGFYNTTIINTDYIMMWTCCILMIFSFIGYPVILDFKGYIHARKNHQKYKFSTFTKVSFNVNVVTVIAFMIIFIALEFNNALAGFTLFEKINAGLYISLSTKSVGLNLFTDINTWLPLTLFIQSFFMLIGGAPSSACGGIKTNAIYIVWCYLKSLFQDHKETIINNRKVPDKTIKLSFVIILLFLLISVIVTIIISWLNPSLNLESIWYDVVSGFTTTGFSTGVLGSFDSISIFIMSIIMGIGRIGILNLLMVFNQSQSKKQLAHIEQDIAI